MSEVLYDGIVDPNAPAGPNPMTICVKESPTAAVCNGHFDQLDLKVPNLAKTLVCDAKPYDCTLPSVPPVSFPGLSP